MLCKQLQAAAREGVKCNLARLAVGYSCKYPYWQQLVKLAGSESSPKSYLQRKQSGSLISCLSVQPIERGVLYHRTGGP